MNWLSVYHPLAFQTTTSFKFVEARILVERRNLHLDFTREFAWSNAERESYLGRLLQDPSHATPYPIVINFDGAGNSTLVDGRERLIAILMFLNGTSKARLFDGRLVSIDDFRDATDLELLSVPYAMTMLTIEQEIALGERLNG